MAPVTPTRAQIRHFLDTMDPADIGDPMRRSLAGAFTRLWQPEGQPAPLPPRPVLVAIRDQFNRLYYHVSTRTWKDTTYRGTPLYKCPTDMWIYQELIDSIQPGLVIETGTFRGGSARFIADRMQLSGRGRVVTIDVDAQPDRPQHPRLTYITGSSVDPDVVARVRGMIDPDAPVMVILDSDHSQSHVAEELRTYAPLVTEGSFLIVEDTNVNGHPVAPLHGPGPFEAVEEFLAGTDEFEVYSRAERYFLTQNPNGYLRRVAPAASEGSGVSTTAPAPGRSSVSDAELDVSTPASTMLEALTSNGSTPRVHLLLETFDPDNYFAGIKTAVEAAGRLARQRGSGLSVHIVQDSGKGYDDTVTALTSVLRESALDDVTAALAVNVPTRREDPSYSSSDLWVATYWTTAHALQALVAAGQASADRVVYLIQDFEPGFYPWGSLYAKASATYSAGFRTLVNSTSLQRFLQDRSEAQADVAFAPAVDPGPLRAAAERWSPAPGGVVRVLFYARPSKPRNMYPLGLAALRAWAAGLPSGLTAHVRLAGEEIEEELDLGSRVVVERLGKVDYQAYFDLLGDTDVGLALMLSPHPGHLALEMPLAGIPTVTNDFEGYRSAWVDGLTVSPPDVEHLAAALAEATQVAMGLDRHTPFALRGDLGTTLPEAVVALDAVLG